MMGNIFIFLNISWGTVCHNSEGCHVTFLILSSSMTDTATKRGQALLLVSDIAQDGI